MFGREFQAGEHRQHVVPSPPTGYGFEKAGYESLRTADSYQFGGGWSAKIVYENDDEGEYAEAILTGPGGVEETIYPGDGRTFEPGELEDEARQLISEYGDSPYEDTYQYNSSHREASRQETASHHLAFFDGFDIPEPRHRVAGWDWDDHLNGFLAAEAAREFTCACGESVPAPGYTDCRCGRRWNAYTISANGSKKMIAREVPVRDGVVMAGRTASRVAAYEEDDGYTSPEPGDSIEVHSGGSYFEVLYDKRIGDHKFRATNGQEFYVTSIVSINENRVDPDKIRLEASRKQADAFYPGDKVSFSPGGEQATVIRWDPAVGYVQIKWDDGQVESINEGMLVRASRKQAGELGDVSDEELLEIFNTATDNENFDVMMTALQELQSRGLGDQAVNRGASRKQAGELWIEDGDTYFFQYDSHAGEFYAEVYPASGSYTWFLSDPTGVNTYGDGYGVATVEEAKAQAEQALTKLIGSEPIVAVRKQAESGVPKFREGDMVIGRGPDMNTHTLREVGSVVEQDGGYFYRLRKLHGSGPGGSRLYAEEHLEGYRLQR